MTNEKPTLKINSNNQIINTITRNVNNQMPEQFMKRRKRRELGNRGYIKKMKNIPFLGIFCAICYAFFMSTSVALLKIVPNLHPISVLVYRCIIQGGIFFLIAIYNQKSLLGVRGERISCTGRAVSGMMNQLGWYTSIRYISLTDSSAIYYSAPAFVTVLAFFMLGEKFGIYECASVVITLIGVTLVSKPGFLPFFDTNLQSSTDFQSNKLNYSTISNLTNSTLTNQIDLMSQTENKHVWGMILAFIGAITFALSNIYLRRLKKTPTEITAFWFAIVTIIICTPLMFILNVATVPKTGLEWAVVGIVGIFSVLGQIAFTLALKIEKAGPVSVAQTLNIVIVLFYQIVFFHESITITSLAGVFLIILSVMIIGFKDMLNETQFIKKAVKKLSKSSNGKFNLDNDLNKSSLKKENNKNIFDNLNNGGNNYEIRVLSSTQIKGSNQNGVCIAGNCKNNYCFNLKEELDELKRQEEQKNMYLNLQSYQPPKYITYNKNDIY